MDKALLIGINKYKESSGNLRGCVNDVKLMYNLITEHFKFNLDNIRVLTDERATFDNIMDRLEWSVKGLKPGDNLFVHYSGHGAQIRDRNGDELDDNLDEIICPHDMDWNRPLLDDYVGEILKTVPKGVYILFIADCCHSATITREMANPDLQIKAKRLIPPFDIMCRAQDRSLKVSHFGKQDYYQEQNHILLSGCRDDQTSADAFIGGDFHGALTYNLHRTIQNYIDMNQELIISNIYQETLTKIKHGGFTQIPQLSGSKWLVDKPMFRLGA